VAACSPEALEEPLGEALGDVLACWDAPDVPSDSAEHPAAASANRQVSPAAGLRRVRIAYPPALVISVSGQKQTTFPEWKCLTPGSAPFGQPPHRHHTGRSGQKEPYGRAIRAFNSFLSLPGCAGFLGISQERDRLRIFSWVAHKKA
jgi:hypothetical protein